jgi:hypothetical protein
MASKAEISLISYIGILPCVLFVGKQLKYLTLMSVIYED